MSKKEKKIISMILEDRFGALSRVIELFGSRGYNLHSICSGESREKGLQRLTLVCYETEKNIQQIVKLLQNIIYVYEAKLVPLENSIVKELVLVKVKLEKKKEKTLLLTIQELKGEVLVTGENFICFQYLGENQQIDKMLDHFRKRYKIIEVSRTGEAALDLSDEDK